MVASRILAAVVACMLALPAQAQGSIAFAEPHRRFPDEPWSVATEFVDWDRDGDLDALLSSFPSTVLYSPFLPGEVQLLENDSHGFFRVAARVEIQTQVLAPGDYDGDGFIDVLTGATVLRNDGRGGFEVQPPTWLAPGWADHAACADVDQDGDLDGLLGGTGGTSALYLLRNHGDASFEVELVEVGPFAREIAVGDLDGDGDVDLVRGQRSALSLRFNDGSGGFQDELQIPVVRPEEVAVGDVTGDRRLDLLYTDESVHLLENRGDRSFTDVSERVPLPAFDYVADLHLVDIDSDGDLDLATCGRLLLNQGGTFKDADDRYPSFDSSRWHEFGDPSEARSGDFDLDGDMDLFLVGENRLLSTGAAGVLRPVDRELDCEEPSLADLDGDGDLDAVATVPDPEGLTYFAQVFLLNDGRGELRIAARNLPGNLAADFDGDGDPDLAALVDDGIELYLNDGHGRFPAEGHACRLLDSRYPRDVGIGDLDGDGGLDLYFATTASGGCSEGCVSGAPDKLWMNNGRGCFRDASAALPAVSDVSQGVELGDLELDGDLDVVTAAPLVLVNQGGGNFEQAFVLHGSYAEDVALGDLDGDLLLDVYLASPGFPGRDRILWNDGQNAFPVVQPTPGFGRRCALGDLDGDGDLDVVESAVVLTYVSGPHEAFLHVLRNDGGAFQPVPILRASSIQFAIGDMDGDGDLDVFDGERELHNLALEPTGRAPLRANRQLR